MSAFEELELKEDATLEEAKTAYKRLARKYHPDVNKSPDAHEKFIRLTEAFERVQVVIANRGKPARIVVKYYTGGASYYGTSNFTITFTDE